MDSKGRKTQNFNINYWLGQKAHHETVKYGNSSDPVLLVQTHAKENQKPSFIDKGVAESINESFYVSLSEDFNPIKNQKALNFLQSAIDHLIESRKVVRDEQEWYKQFYEYVLNESTVQAVSIGDLEKYYTPTNKKDEQDKLNSLREDLSQFHKQGLVLYYPVIDADIVWLNPAGLVQYIHEKILQETEISKHEGKVPFKTFSGYDQNIIRLLQEQKVIFEHLYGEKGKEYIIPNFLPLVKDNEIEYDLLTFGLNNLSFTLKFKDFLPIGLINQLICFFGRQPDRKKFWRDQLLFTFEKKSKVLLRLDFEQLKIIVYCSFLNGVSTQEQESINKYLFYCIMAMYWDLEVWSYEQTKIVAARSNSLSIEEFALIIEEKKARLLKEGRTAWTPDLIGSINLVELPNDSYIQIFENDAYKPVDLYITRDDKYFVNYYELHKHDIKETKIASRKIIDIGDLSDITFEIAVKPFQIFTNKKFNTMKKIFISYSRQDDEYKNQLKKYLGMLSLYKIADNWSCDEITPGLWHDQIQKELEESDIIIFMLSMSFFSSYYILNDEVKKGIELAKESGKQIVCVLVRTFPMMAANKFIGEELTSKDGHIYYVEEIKKYQFLPYDNNITTELEKGTRSALKPLEDWDNISKPLTQIVDKIAEILKP